MIKVPDGYRVLCIKTVEKTENQIHLSFENSDIRIALNTQDEKYSELEERQIMFLKGDEGNTDIELWGAKIEIMVP